MEIKEFLIKNLERIVDKIEDIHFIYNFKEETNTHIVFVLSEYSISDNDEDLYNDLEYDLLEKIFNKYPNEKILITHNNKYKISNENTITISNKNYISPSDRFNNVIPIKTEIYHYFREKLIQKEAEREGKHVMYIRDLLSIEYNNYNSDSVYESIMLYFTCLLSVKNDNIGLFNIFNYWKAYPECPHDVDVYNIHKNNWFGKSSENNLFCEFIQFELNLIQRPFVLIDNYKQIIDDSLDYLYSFNQGLSTHFKPDLKDQNQVYYLCYLIHDLSLWYDAMDIQTRMLSLSLPNLIKERDLLINIK